MYTSQFAMGSMRTLLILCSFGVFSASNDNEFEVGFVTPDLCPLDHGLKDTAYVTHKVSMEILCARYCKRDSNCLSYNYETNGTCELNSGTVDLLGSNLEERPGFIYYEKVGLNMKSLGCSEFEYSTEVPCSPLVSVDSSENVITNRGDTQGDWTKDLKSPDGRVYYLSGYSGTNALIEYPSESDYINNANGVTHSLPVSCDGCNNILYDGKWYCNEGSTKNIAVIDISSLNIVARIPFDSVPEGDPTNNANAQEAGNRNQCAYGWGGYSDFDIEVDEKGLWVIWGRRQDSCNLAITKIDTTTYTKEYTWFVPARKTSKGNAFMKCGIMYVMASYSGNPTFIEYAYDTSTSTLTQYTSGDGIAWYNHHGYLSHAHYDMHEGVIYTWDRKHQAKITIT